MNVLKTVLAGP